MIDKMIRCVNLDKTNTISCLHQWFEKCPPQGKEKHWVDGRSAKETAKHWLHTIPSEFKVLFNKENLEYHLCSPEYVSNFDSYKGNGRNHDLLILAKDKDTNNIVISIESKADESFGDTIDERITQAKREKTKNSNSKAEDRIRDLRLAIFGQENQSQEKLRYQLLTAVAGTLSEAKKQNCAKAFFVVQTFLSDEIDAEKHKENKNDLDKFVSALAGHQFEMHNGILYGPFHVSGNNDKISSAIELWVGKFEINI